MAATRAALRKLGQWLVGVNVAPSPILPRTPPADGARRHALRWPQTASGWGWPGVVQDRHDGHPCCANQIGT
jgi:hypothetical protein